MSSSTESQLPPPPPYTIPAHSGSETAGQPDRSNRRVLETPVILGLPASVWLHINSLLPPESQAALTLVNKSALSVLGQDVGDGFPRVKPWPMDMGTRRKFLELLDRDLYLLTYCSICDRIHNLEDTNGRICDALVVGKQDQPPGVGQRNFSYMLPSFGLVHVIMRNYRAGRRDYRDLLNLLCYEGLAIRTDAEFRLRRGAVTEGCRIVDSSRRGKQGARFMFMEQRVFPVTLPVSQDMTDEPYEGINTVRNFYELGYYVWWIPRICNHRRWRTEYPFLLPNTPELTTRLKGPKGIRALFSRSTKGGVTDLKTRFQNFALDPADFRGPQGESCLDGKQFVSGSLEPRLHCALSHHHGADGCPCGAGTQFGIVRSCDRCDTDFCFNVVTRVVSDSGEGKAEKEQSFLVFTTWKNLGYGFGFSRDECRTFAAHLASNNVRSSGPLGAYKRYGKLDRWPNNYGPLVYRPTIYPGLFTAAVHGIRPTRQELPDLR
ncbi:hypothetical protein V8F20_010681 [Naviculisporaceae sp. PSN 640]